MTYFNWLVVSFSNTDPNQDQLRLFESVTGDHGVDPEWILSREDNKRERSAVCETTGETQ